MRLPPSKEQVGKSGLRVTDIDNIVAVGIASKEYCDVIHDAETGIDEDKRAGIVGQHRRAADGDGVADRLTTPTGAIQEPDRGSTNGRLRLRDEMERKNRVVPVGGQGDGHRIGENCRGDDDTLGDRRIPGRLVHVVEIKVLKILVFSVGPCPQLLDLAGFDGFLIEVQG